MPRGFGETRESRSTSKVRNPPVPPKRDPSTTLSISRARAKSLCITSSNSSDTVNSGLPMSTSTSSEMSGQQVDDQETNKSSSPSTSVESMVCQNNVTLRAKDGNGNKIASIRSRSSRRISAFELEKFFARQGDPNQILLIDDKCKGQGEANHQVTTLQALKKKRNKKLQKDFHSTPDIQEQLALELAKQQIASQQGNTKIKYDNNTNRLSTSQEDLRSILPIYSETLTLRNGKIVQDEDSNSNCKPSTLPSTLTPGSEESQSVVVKVDVSGNRVKSDYANFAQLNREDGNNKHSPNDQATTPSVPLSSFKPTLPLSTDTESLEALQKVNYASPDKLKQPGQGMVNNQQQSAKQAVNTLRPAKHVKHSSLINTDGSESLNGNQPYIPEPDYSSSEDDGNTPTNVSGRDLSTFKGTTNSLPKSSNNRMASSYHESVVNSKESESSAMSTSTSVLEPGREKEFDVQLKAKVAAIAVASSKGSLDQRSNQSEEIRVIKSTRKDERGTISEPLVKPKGDHINKVKESIAVFERRSSLTGEGVGTSAAIAAVQASCSASSTFTRPKKDDNTNLESSGSNVASSAANALRVSKSCFEVDICDNGSSGVSSDIDADNYTHHHHHHSQQQSKSNATDLSNRNQQIHSLNRRNSAIVSEKIANLMASGTPITVIRANSQEARQILTNQSQHQDKEQAIRRASIASCATDKGDNLNSNVVVNSEVCSQSTGSGSKAAPTMAKTWSEISSAIRAAKGCTTTSSSTVPVKSGPNTANSGNNFTAVKQTGLRPTSAPITCNNNSNKIGHNNSNNSNNSNKDGSDRSTKGRDGLAAVNEVDVLAELVPPPPEFAAPPPQPMDSRPGAIKIQVGGPKQPPKQHQPVSNHQPQLTTVYHQQHQHPQQQQQHQQHHHHHGQQTHSKMVTTLPATQGAPVNTVISGVGIKTVQQQVQQPINNQRKEEIRIINPQQAQVHIIHKPTPQQQACVYNSLACEANPQQLIRKTNTPPPPPPPEFSDLSAASRLGIVGAHLPAGHPHHHTIHFPQQHQQQAKIPYTLYPENPKQPQQYQSYLQHQQPQQQFVTLTRYVGKQGQIITARHRYNADQLASMSRSVGSDSPLTVACSDNVVYKVNSQGVLEPVGHHHSGGYHQFATLSRGRPQQLRAASPSPSAASYSDYTRLTVQNRLLRQQQQQQQQQQAQAQAQAQQQQQQQQQQQHQHQHVQQGGQQIIYQTNQGQPIVTGHSHQYYQSDIQKQAMHHQQLQHQQQQSQAQQAHLHQHSHQVHQAHPHQHAQSHQIQQIHNHQIVTNQGNASLVAQIVPASNYAQSQPKQPAHPPPPGPPPSLQKHPATFPRRSMVDWSEEDVCDWISSIGMVEHRSKFEYINGVKLLRLDNNDLIGIGVRPSQHRCFILEKIKQHLHYQQQHPPVQ